MFVRWIFDCNETCCVYNTTTSSSSSKKTNFEQQICHKLRRATQKLQLFKSIYWRKWQFDLFPHRPHRMVVYIILLLLKHSLDVFLCCIVEDEQSVNLILMLFGSNEWMRVFFFWSVFTEYWWMFVHAIIFVTYRAIRMRYLSIQLVWVIGFLETKNQCDFCLNSSNLLPVLCVVFFWYFTSKYSECYIIEMGNDIGKTDEPYFGIRSGDKGMNCVSRTRKKIFPNYEFKDKRKLNSKWW